MVRAAIQSNKRPPPCPHPAAFDPQMLKRRADELTHQCEGGHGVGGYVGAVASRDNEGGSKDLRLCRSCGSERHFGGGKRGGGSPSGANAAAGRPGTAPAKIRRCPRGGGGAGRAGGDGDAAEAGKQAVFANLMTTAADNPCNSGGGGCSSSPCRCCGYARSNQPTGRNSRVSPRGTGRRAQTAARARGDNTSIDNDNHAIGCFAGGGIKKHPVTRAQTAGRYRVQSAATSRCHPSAVTPPPRPRRSARDGDGGSKETAVILAAASAGGIEEPKHPSREGEAEGLAGDGEIAADEDATPSYRRQQTEGAQEEEEGLLAKRSDPSRSIDVEKRQPRDDASVAEDSAAAAAAVSGTTAVDIGLSEDVSLEHGFEGVGRESSAATAEGRAVQV